ncbi:hypothetical protein ADUPG1_011694, partial [Aduncisulcus paluster]
MPSCIYDSSKFDQWIHWSKRYLEMNPIPTDDIYRLIHGQAGYIVEYLELYKSKSNRKCTLDILAKYLEIDIYRVQKTVLQIIKSSKMCLKPGNPTKDTHDAMVSVIHNCLLHFKPPETKKDVYSHFYSQFVTYFDRIRGIDSLSGCNIDKTLDVIHTLIQVHKKKSLCGNYLDWIDLGLQISIDKKDISSIQKYLTKMRNFVITWPEYKLSLAKCRSALKKEQLYVV